jgi:hypothetical protein
MWVRVLGVLALVLATMAGAVYLQRPETPGVTAAPLAAVATAPVPRAQPKPEASVRVAELAPAVLPPGTAEFEPAKVPGGPSVAVRVSSVPVQPGDDARAGLAMAQSLMTVKRVDPGAGEAVRQVPMPQIETRVRSEQSDTGQGPSVR